MQRKLSPVLIELIQDACCKVFWYKKDLLRFLRLHKVPDNNFYLLESMTKAEFLGILFCDLNKNDCHHDLIYNIGVDIINMSSFPHLEKLENSELKIKDAQQSIKNLKPHIEKIKNIFSKNILTNEKISNIMKTTKRKREQSKEDEKVRT